MVDLATRRVPAIIETEWLKVLPPAARFSFFGDSTAQQALLPLWKVDFSTTACRANAFGPRATLWLGPGEYLLLDLSGNATAAGLEASLTGTAHSLVDVSHRQFAVEVTGTHAATILNGACPLDLDLSAFPVGMCTRTVFAKADIVLWRTAADRFHIEIWRSFAAYVLGVLGEIAGEYYSPL